MAGKARYDGEEHLSKTLFKIAETGKKESLEELIKAGLKTRKEAEEELAAFRKRLEQGLNEDVIDDYIAKRKRATQITTAWEEKRLKESKDRIEKAQIHADRANREKRFQAEHEERLKQEVEFQAQKQKLEAKIAAGGAKKEIADAKKELKNVNEQLSKTSSQIQSDKDRYNTASELIESEKRSQAEELTKEGDFKAAAEAYKELAEQTKGDKKKSEEYSKKYYDAELQANNQRRKEQKDEAAAEKRAQIRYRADQLRKIMLIGSTIGEALDTLGDIADESFDKMMEAIDKPISTFFEYQTKYQARLEGSENKYNKLMSNINKQIGLSPFVKQADMVKNLQQLIDKGINYNVELRAYLATVSEGIASTFDAFDSNLLRLIRIQQNDSTAARLGIESALTQFLNNMYSDTSYLGEGGSGVADQVSAALLDASAQLTHQGAAEMEFIAQKWLGSLYSLGVSGEAVQNIAAGLGYLGSGNIEALSSNESLMSLLAMSATRGGTTISEILTGNLTAEKTNSLLEGMVKYLSEIANNTDSNNVTRSALAQVFGITNTDLRSISNLSADDITKIATTNLNYGGALVTAQQGLYQMAKNTHISTILNNVMDNASTGMALTIGGNPILYGMAKALSFVSSLVGDRGLEIPGIQALGTGTASGIDILSIAKAGVVGTAALATLIGSLNSLSGGGLPKLSSFKGYEEALQRGSGIILQPKGVQSGFSESAVYNSKGSASTDDLGSSAMQSANESAKQNQSTEDQQAADDATKFYKESLPLLQTIVDTQADIISNSKKLHVVLEPNEDNKVAKVELSDISDAAKSYLKQLLLASFADEFINPATGAQTPSITDQIASALQGLKVNIGNDFFDDVIMKNVQGGN